MRNAQQMQKRKLSVISQAPFAAVNRAARRDTRVFHSEGPTMLFWLATRAETGTRDLNQATSSIPSSCQVRGRARGKAHVKEEVACAVRQGNPSRHVHTAERLSPLVR